MPARPATRPARHQVRIIGGRWKRTPLVVAEVDGLRPTPDRVRVTVFNWLGQDLGGKRCLDLFAGTGALGFEAASRGAAQVICVEPQRAAADAIRRTIAKLDAREIELRQADARTVLAALERNGDRFDVIFLDPPFHQGWLARVLPQVTALLTTHGVIYAESEAALDPAELTGLGLSIQREDSAGQVHYHLLTRAPRDPASA